MTVGEWLSCGRNLNVEIQALKDAFDKALNNAVGGAVNYSTERVQTRGGNGSESRFVAYSQYSAELEERIKELWNYQRDVLRLINRITNSRYRALLIEYYVNCKSWEQVAESLNCDLSWLLKRDKGLRDKAIRAADIVYKDLSNIQ